MIRRSTRYTSPVTRYPDTPLFRSAEHSGHRGRLRNRLLDVVGAALLDQELLEYLLALALPRRDTKPLASRLITRFGSYAAVVSAPPEELAGAGELTEGLIAAIKIAQASDRKSVV